MGTSSIHYHLRHILHLDGDLDGLGLGLACLNSNGGSLAGAEPLAGLGGEADGADVAPRMRVLVHYFVPITEQGEGEEEARTCKERR
jgi:hypothetical protein